MGYAYSENYFNPKFVGQMRDPESARDYMQSGITVGRRGGL